MKALVYDGSQRVLTQVDCPQPRPDPGEILIRVRACAVCHTDLHIVDGDLAPPRLPVVCGHQAVGVVEDVGEGVARQMIGRRVGVPWLHDTCGACAYCRRGEENLCDAARFTGFHTDGGFAEYVVARPDFAPAIPDFFEDVSAAPLLCAGVIGYRTLKKAGVKRGDRIGLFGFGSSAHIALQIARHWGCEVHVFTRSDEHRRHAKTLGAAWAGGTEDPSAATMDRAAVFAPSGAVVVEALKRIRKGGVVAINAIHLDAMPSFDYSLLFGERGLVSVSNATRADATEFLALAAQIRLRVDAERRPLGEANAVLDRIRRRELVGAAVLIP